MLEVKSAHNITWCGEREREREMRDTVKREQGECPEGRKMCGNGVVRQGGPGMPARFGVQSRFCVVAWEVQALCLIYAQVILCSSRCHVCGWNEREMGFAANSAQNCRKTHHTFTIFISFFLASLAFFLFFLFLFFLFSSFSLFLKCM